MFDQFFFKSDVNFLANNFLKHTVSLKNFQTTEVKVKNVKKIISQNLINIASTKLFKNKMFSLNKHKIAKKY